MFEEPVSPESPERFGETLGKDGLKDFTDRSAAVRDRLEGRTVWHVNSTAKGGGVAEMLTALLSYDAGAGITNRWLVIDAEKPFLDVTKKLHNRLHGEPDDGAFGDHDRELYDETINRESEEFARMISAGDVVLLHDPQVAGLVSRAKDLGATVIWRAHIGADEVDDVVRDAWAFLRPYIERADGYVFSREAHIWDDLPRECVAVIPPCIDAFSPKNEELSSAAVDGILAAAEMQLGQGNSADGETARVTLTARVRHGDPLEGGFRVVTQIGRWDVLKDPAGVIKGFAEHIAPDSDAHLVLAGPLADQVDDDPDGAKVMEEVLEEVGSSQQSIQDRIHIFNFPQDDIDQSALMVNAMQRRSEIVVQKSLAEGFGLTVAEAMWKSRPMVASGVGGIQDQIEHGRTGLLIDDPKDLASFGRAVVELLDDPDRAKEIGRKARESVRERFLVPSHLTRWYEFLEATMDRARSETATCS